MHGVFPLLRFSKNDVEGEIWVFVRVIDNWGDVGVGWRLACQLAQYFLYPVRLWIDDVAALHHLVLADELDEMQSVVVEHWQNDAVMAAQLARAADPVMVVEAFACDLPQSVLARMVLCRPLWLNWEYLTAEDWAVGLQAMPSLQANGLAKYFWFMGFDVESGGLLRECDYVTVRDEFRQQPRLQQAFKLRYGLPLQHTGMLWLLFAYADVCWSRWLEMWQDAGMPMTLWLAGDEVVNSWRAAAMIPADVLQDEGDVFVLDNLTLVRIPFVPQSAFDRLLWLADGAVVRGEDSFVRALWAGLPFFWHIYRQEDGAHLLKLDAFWQKACTDWPLWLRQSFLALSDDLNGGDVLDAQSRLKVWQELCYRWHVWADAALAWSDWLHMQDSAMERLARFTQFPLK